MKSLKKMLAACGVVVALAVAGCGADEPAPPTDSKANAIFDAECAGDCYAYCDALPGGGGGNCKPNCLSKCGGGVVALE